jgi:hypothetical protein
VVKPCLREENAFVKPSPADLQCSLLPRETKDEAGIYCIDGVDMSKKRRVIGTNDPLEA